MLLPLLCTSLQSSVHIATAFENLATEIHDLSSQVAKLDLSPQLPNLAPLQASIRDIASSLSSATQAPLPPQRPGVPPPPATPTQLAKGKGKKEVLRLLPHHYLIWSCPPPQLTRISRDTTCQLPPPHYMATLRRLPRNTPTPGKRRNSPNESTPAVPLEPLVILTMTGDPPPPCPQRPPPPTLKLSHPRLKERRVVRREVLSRLPPLRLRLVRFLRNLPLLSPKLYADLSPPEPPSNPTQKRSRLQPISQTSLSLFSDRPTAPFPFPSLARSTTKAPCHCWVPTFTPSVPLIPLISLFLPRG